MNKHFIVGVVGVLLGTTLASAQMGGMGGMGGHGMMLRHRYAMMNGIPPQYAKSHNPLVANEANLATGKTLFEQYCATCHGTTGRGDGPAAQGLTPAPTNLSATIRGRFGGDAFLNWTISEGGTPVNSAMPPFKEVLSKDELWKVVLYLRTL